MGANARASAAAMSLCMFNLLVVGRPAAGPGDIGVGPEPKRIRQSMFCPGSFAHHCRKRRSSLYLMAEATLTRASRRVRTCAPAGRRAALPSNLRARVATRRWQGSRASQAVERSLHDRTVMKRRTLLPARPPAERPVLAWHGFHAYIDARRKAWSQTVLARLQPPFRAAT